MSRGKSMQTFAQSTTVDTTPFSSLASFFAVIDVLAKNYFYSIIYVANIQQKTEVNIFL